MEKEQVQNMTEETVEQQEEREALAAGMAMLERIEGISLIPELTVVREKYKERGGEFWAYRAKGQKHGRDVLVSLVAGTTYSATTRSSTKDRGIYDQLNDLYQDCKDIRFGIKWQRSQNGRLSASYFVTGQDPEDDVFCKVPVNLQRSSDGSALEDLLRRISKRNNVYIPSIL